MTIDPRVDHYIAKAAPFAQPILLHLRELFHRAGAELDETIKWGMPAFVCKGQQVANIAAFKAHVTCNFWRREIVGEAPAEMQAMGQFGKVLSLADLPADAEILRMVACTVELIDAGAKTPRRIKHSKPLLEMPTDFALALALAGEAQRHFDGFPPGAQRDYIEWVMGAKRAETRAKRITDGALWIAENKRLNWQYANC